MKRIFAALTLALLLTAIVIVKDEFLMLSFESAEPLLDRGRTRIEEHRINMVELEGLKQKIGVSGNGSDYNEIVDGHGTGWAPPTRNEWVKIGREARIVETVDFEFGQSAPSSVDHTLDPWFPPIGDQDREGSCTAWAVGYYVKTFQEAKEHGWNVSEALWDGGEPSSDYQNRIVSPDFVYHLINHGGDNGSSFYMAINLICSVGACSWEKMPYDPDDHTSWPSEEAWREAPLYRSNSSGYRYMHVNTDSKIENLKNWIASDHLAMITVDGNQFSSLTGDDVWTLDNYVNPSENHANTIVGYDDNFEYTEEGELRSGAFKIANSWGIGHWLHNPWENVYDGCYWISYEAMKQRVEYCRFYPDLIDYEPEVVASFRINHSQRAECNVAVGIGNTSSPIETKLFNEYIDGGSHPFCPDNILFDVTELKDNVSTIINQSFFLRVYDGDTSTTGNISKFSIEYSYSQDPPISTINHDTVYARTLFTPPNTVWTDEKLVCQDEDFIDGKISTATAGNGSIYVVYDDWYPTIGQYAVFLKRSRDNGKTWATTKTVHNSSYNLRHPSIAIDPYTDDIFVAVELERASDDHDILVMGYVNNSWSWSPVAATLGTDERFPSITSEYQYGEGNKQYISYEQLHSYDDRDLMFAKSDDHGTNWSIEKLRGDQPDSNVHAQTSITNAEGYIYIAYKWGANYTGPCEIRLDRSTDFGNTWAQYVDIDGCPKNCGYPSIAATHGNETVLVTFQYAESETNDDVRFSYSTDKGENWTKGNVLFNSTENERKPAVTVDGEGETTDNIAGYLHIVCQVDNNAKYRKTHSNTPNNWTTPQIVGKRWIGAGLAITTQFRAISEQFYPCVLWTDSRTKNLYYSTKPEAEDAYLAVRGLNDRIYYRFYNSTSDVWEEWNRVPAGTTCDSPAAAVSSGRLYLVVRGMNGGSLWFTWINLTDHSFPGWTRLGGATTSAPTLVSSSSQLILLVRGLDNRIYLRSYNLTSDEWQGWDATPAGVTCDSPAAAALNNMLHIAVRGFSETSVSENRSMWYGSTNLTTGEFSGWTRLTGATDSTPTLTASNTLNELYLTVRGLDGRVYYSLWNGTEWEGWSALSEGTTCDSLGATVLGDELHFVVRGMSGTTLWHTSLILSTDDHSEWKVISGQTPSSPKFTS